MGPSEAVLLGLLLGALGATACGSHSLRYFKTRMTDPGPGMPQFVIVGYVDGELFGKYDSKSRWVHPIAEMLPQEDREHWDTQTQKARDVELVFCGFLGRLQVHYNKSGERPKVRVWGKEADGILTLSCRAYGFYPRPIAISWMKDGMVRDQETHWGGIMPNSDGTYYASAVINVLPEDGNKYWCRVEHVSLPQPGLFLWEPLPNLIPVVAGAVVTIVAVIAAVVGLVVWKSKSG